MVLGLYGHPVFLSNHRSHITDSLITCRTIRGPLSGSVQLTINNLFLCMNWTPLIFGWDRLNSKRLVHFILTSVGSFLDINALEIWFLILPHATMVFGE